MSATAQPVTLAISGMSCGHCIGAVKSALNAVPGIVVQDVTIGSAAIVIDPTTTPDAALDAIRNAGYEPTVVTPRPGVADRAS